jgi:hypothetical protein
LIWDMWLLSSFETILFFQARYYADISRSRKRQASEFFAKTWTQRVSSSMRFTPAHPNRTWRSQELSYHIHFLKYSSIAKHFPLCSGSVNSAIFQTFTSRGFSTGIEHLKERNDWKHNWSF